MAMTPAEKQRRYRERHLNGDGTKERIQCVVGFHSKLKLVRLAHYHGYSMTTLIETLAAEAESALLRQLSSDDCNAYYDRRLQRNQPQP